MAALMLGVGGAALALATREGEPQAQKPQSETRQVVCRPGAAPTRAYGKRPPERFLRYGTRPIVIGCVELPSGRRFEPVGYQLVRRTRSSLCIDRYEPATGVGAGCGTNRVFGGGAIDATGVEWAQPIIVEGAV
jgi:hypothetical protein